MAALCMQVFSLLSAQKVRLKLSCLLSCRTLLCYCTTPEVVVSPEAWAFGETSEPVIDAVDARPFDRPSRPNRIDERLDWEQWIDSVCLLHHHVR